MKLLILSFFLIFAATVVFAITQEELQAWIKFKQEHSKLFLSRNSETIRRSTFLKNLAEFIKLQTAQRSGKIKYIPKLYEHADLTPEEFTARYGGAKAIEVGAVDQKSVSTATTIPTEFDSRKKGWVGPVRNQGKCNSCWGFAAVACAEIGYAVKGQTGLDFSEQQLVDCAKKDCNPASMDLGFNYLHENGAVLEKSYTYSGSYSGKCKIAKGSYKVGTKVFPSADKTSIKAALLKLGALEIAVDCTPYRFYGGGIFHGSTSTNVNHAVTLIGWGVEKGEEYWIVRNSWGETFGEKGYIRLSTGSNGGYNLKYTVGVNI